MWAGDASERYSQQLPGMKVSVSLPDEDIEFLNDAANNGMSSRSAAVHKGGPSSLLVRTRRRLMGRNEIRMVDLDPSR